MFFSKQKPIVDIFDGWKTCWQRKVHNNYSPYGSTINTTWDRIKYSGNCVHISASLTLYETSEGWISKVDLKFPTKCT